MDGFVIAAGNSIRLSCGGNPTLGKPPVRADLGYYEMVISLEALNPRGSFQNSLRVDWQEIACLATQQHVGSLAC